MCAKTVLVVDDDPHIRHMLDFKLGRAGFTVMTASNAGDAFELARRHHPEVIVTDYQMPGGNGLELCERLKKTPETAAIPVLMLTARGYKVAPDDLATTNLKGLIPKPFSTRDLIARIQELGGGSKPAEGGGDDETGAAAA